MKHHSQCSRFCTGKRFVRSEGLKYLLELSIQIQYSNWTTALFLELCLFCFSVPKAVTKFNLQMLFFYHYLHSPIFRIQVLPPRVLKKQKSTHWFSFLFFSSEDLAVGRVLGWEKEEIGQSAPKLILKVPSAFSAWWEIEHVKGSTVLFSALPLW